MSIRLEHLNYVYSLGTAYEKHALKDISLTIPHGEFVGIIGHTGSGKSTLIQHLNGLIKATSGALYYNDENIYEEGYNMRELRNQVGLVFQYPEHQLFEIDVMTDVCFGPKNQGLGPKECKERALEALGHIDPELIERMEVQKKRRLPRPLRAGLIAACVCLALVGTVGAVMVGFDFVGSFSQTGYTVYGELTRYPMSAFSQEFQELTADPGISDVECRSVSELEALLGIDLYDNPVLDAADEQRSHRHILSRGADGTVEKIRMMNFYYFVPAGRSRTELGNGEPDSDLVDMVQVGLYTDLYTEYGQGELENDFYYPNRTTPDAMDREEYLTAQGLPVVILTFVSEDSEGDIRVSREAHFIYRGMRWCITCSPGRAGSQDQAEQTLKDILDAFA